LTAYLVSPFVHYWRTWQEKTFIRRAFAMYLAPQVVNRLLEQPDRLNLGGEAVEATVLFSDLAGFTTFSERLTPHQVIALLNRYLGRFSEIVFDHQGMIDKFIGDAVMAVWGVPLAQADHAGQACRTALAMERAVEELKRREVGLTGLTVEVRVGLNSGPMVAGNVGASRFFNYTVLGHEVNLASRLEGLNRVDGTRIILGQGTAELVAEAFELRELDRVRVKGQATPVTVHELQAPKGGLDQVQAEVNRLYALGRRAYLARRFAEAAGLFDQAQALRPQDGPSRAMAGRCRAYLAAPPEPGWEGIYDAQEK
jgi:adenylate cyclase